MPVCFDTLNANISPLQRVHLHRFAARLRRKTTPAERLLWAWLRGRRRHGFRFHRQHVLGPYIADFYCRQAALVIELDGGYHCTRASRDARRDQFLASAGLTVVRFENGEVLCDPRGVVAKIDALLVGCEAR